MPRQVLDILTSLVYSQDSSKKENYNAVLSKPTCLQHCYCDKANEIIINRLRQRHHRLLIILIT